MRPDPGSPLRGLLVRVGVLGALVLAAVGLRAGNPLDANGEPWNTGDLLHHVGTGLQIALLVWVVVVLVAIVLSRQGGSSAPPVGRNPFVSVALLLLGILAAVIYRSLHAGPRTIPSPAAAKPSPTPSAGHQAAATPTDHHALLVLLMLGAAAVLTAVLVSRRTTAEVVAEVLEPDPVAGGLVAAARSFRETADQEPRARVVLAYAAFEEALARQGVARGPSGTPDALLRRAVAAGAPAQAAEDLTRLFGAARFGVEPVTAAHVRAAERTLAELTALR